MNTSKLGLSIKQIIIYLLAALFSAACASCYINGFIIGPEKADVLLFAFKVLLFFGIFLVSHILFNYLRNKSLLSTESKLLWNRLTLTLDKKSVWTMAIVLFIAWLPYLIIFYPGVSNYDTANQINDFFNGTASMPFGFVEGQEGISYFLNDHHPVFTTLVMVPFVALGRLVGYPNFGMLLYVVLQMALTAFSFAVMIGFLDKIKCSYVIRKVSFLFLTFMPFIPLHAICMLKDCLYAAIFVLYLVYYVSLIKDIEIGKHQVTVFTVLSLLTVLTKKTGIYLVVICNVVLLIKLLICTKKKKEIQEFSDDTLKSNTVNGLAKKQCRGIVISILLPIAVMWLIFPLIIYPAFNIFPGGKQELLGTCFQQTAKVIVDCGEDALSKEELDSIGKVISLSDINDTYYIGCTDAVKATYNLHATSEEVSDYLKTWIRVGLRHPIKYLEATLSVCGGFFAPKKVIDIFDAIPVTEPDGVFSEFSNPGMFNGLRKVVSGAYYYCTQTPGVDILLYIFPYVWLIPLVVFVSSKKGSVGLSLMPIWISILILVVCPICYARYAISQIYAVPLILGIGLTKNND